MYGVGSRGLCGCEDVVDPQVRLRRRRRTDAPRLVRHRHVRCASVSFREDGDAFDAEALGGADDAAGDLAAVRHQDLPEHARRHRHTS